MANALDSAAYFRTLPGVSGQMQLQKLLYYSQAWSLVWTGQQAFEDRIEAWVDGPVIRNVWTHFKWTPREDWHGNTSGLSAREIIIADAIAKFYGSMSGSRLRDLFHEEAPWVDAFNSVRNAEIKPLEMLRFYSKKAVSSEEVPMRPALEEHYVDDQVFVDAAEEQIARWQETLDLLAR